MWLVVNAGKASRPGNVSGFATGRDYSLTEGKAIWDEQVLCYRMLDSYLVHVFEQLSTGIFPKCPSWWRPCDTCRQEAG
ncbi:rCG45192 [Rattus norvegicus]|uniref:RCG45192 n=1 Tax=Rattus norvegicus TaxID=10116 RepID=A6KLN5_RAT|nr:rCG45192 [Rattus norvegicus]